MPFLPKQQLTVSHSCDVGEARRLTKALAGNLGFNASESEELAIVASELASNLVKHANGGLMILTPLEEGGRVGIRIESRDNGPGIKEIEQAITDGFSTSGSLGCGLGAVNRLMDEFEVQPRLDGKPGTQISCLRLKRDYFQKIGICPLSFGIATRAYRHLDFNGDSFVIKRWGTSALIALIDGLGHGQFAHHAALAAREYIENHYDQPLEALFRGTGRACRATRGVVMAIALFDWGAEPITLTFSSIGNIETRAFGSAASMNFIRERGVVGFNAGDPVVTKNNWNPEAVLVMHTDGLNSAWRWTDFPELAGIPVAHTARYLLHKLAKNDDDTTVIVASFNCKQTGDFL